LELSGNRVVFGGEDLSSSSSVKNKECKKIMKNLFLPLSTILLSFGRLPSC
jgi:acetate kinase